MKRTLVLLLLAAAPLVTAACENPAPVHGPEAGRIHEYLTRATAFGFSGVVLVARDGEVVLHAGYGEADREAGLLVTPETVFDIGSITKQFTAAAILALEEEGKLRVEDPISRFFDDVPADKRAITVHQLLTHSAGLRRNFGDDYQRMPRDSLVRLALDSELLWGPGTRFRYSNAGYSLLGAIVEKLSGRSYERYLSEALFGTAGLERTGYLGPDWSKERVAVGYRAGERWGTPLDHAWAEDGPWWNLRANGGLLSSARDLYRWHRALETVGVLTAASREKLFSPHVPESEDGTSHYGYGWEITPTERGTRLVSHNGGNDVFFADFRRYIDEDVVVIFLTNEAANRDVESRILRLVFGREVRLPPAAAAEVPSETLDRYAGTYRLPLAAELKVVVQDGRLSVQTADPEVALLLVPLPEPGPEAASLLDDVESRTTAVVDALAAGSAGPFRDAYLEEGGPDVEEEVEYWTRAFQVWQERYGDYRGSSVLASTAGSGPAAVRRMAVEGETVDTYVVARFERGARLIAFRQAAGGEPAGFYVDALPPDALPGEFSFVSLSATEFATFHLGFEAEGRVTFERGPDGAVETLRVLRPEGAVVASIDRTNE